MCMGLEGLSKSRNIFPYQKYDTLKSFGEMARGLAIFDLPPTVILTVAGGVGLTKLDSQNGQEPIKTTFIQDGS
jgi:hypothetical protein